MAKRFLSSIRLATLSEDPESASNGDIYYNAETGRAKFYQNDSWVPMPETLGELSDISASELSSGQVLTYNETLSKWEGKELPPPTTPSGNTFPQNPSTGDFFYNTETDKLYFYAGEWNEIPFNITILDGGDSTTVEFYRTINGGDSTTIF
jgi:hypothetical protein